MTPKSLSALVWAHHREHGRHTLPWRRTRDPYRILVSEVMLQQTQVERVIPYYRSFLRRFPSVTSLATAPLADVLALWQGLGYNRRAKMLHEAAKAVVKEHGGRMPETAAELENLPGVGPYTAAAVAAFAYNEDVLLIETNIRTVLLQHLLPGETTVSDKELMAHLATLLPKGRAREWYAALMDYGSFLKKSGTRLNARSRNYTKQSAFAGSTREARGAILKALVGGPRTLTFLVRLLGKEREPQMIGALKRLYAEGMIEKRGRYYRLPSAHP